MGLAGGVRSRTAPGRSGQGELAKASWESASSGRTGVRPPRMNLRCEKHGGLVRAAPVTKTRDLGPFRGVRRNSCPARRAVTLHSVAILKLRRSATAPAASGSLSQKGDTRMVRASPDVCAERDTTGWTGACHQAWSQPAERAKARR